ncbi:hypothetical protein PAPHI01_1752 [Pancytospora philotis]|nr:hypothetical protein PAPHI01_1752 [Pancytospora philotis]
MLLGLCPLIVSFVHGRPGDDVDMVVENSSLQCDAVQSRPAAEGFFTSKEIELLQWLCVKDTLTMIRSTTGNFGSERNFKLSALALAQKKNPNMLAHTIIDRVLRGDSLEDTMKYLISLTAIIDFAEDRPAVFALIGKLLTPDCIDVLSADFDVGNPAHRDYTRLIKIYKVDTDSDRVRDIRRELVRPIDELLDSYWTPPSPALPASSDE